MKDEEDGTAASPGSEHAPEWAERPDAGRLGAFLLGPVLGQGGMGVVNRAWDSRLRRQVALKRILLPDPLLYLRFLREAQHQARLEHPNICRVFEAGTDGETPYIAMQLIEGLPLDALDPLDPALEPRALARIMAQAASALQAAHDQQLIHRDIKPSNVLLEPQEDGSLKPYLLDFGLALDASGGEIRLSLDTLGTPEYMSPEQSALGSQPGPASDIYSLGAAFHPIFLRSQPNQAPTVLSPASAPPPSHPSRPLLPFAGAPATLPRDLEAILLKCLEPEPGRRYASARDLREDLERWLQGHPTQARPLGGLGRAWKALKRRRAFALAAASLLVCGAILAGWNLHFRSGTRRQTARAHGFATELEELQTGLRKERMLPAHDIRPAEQRLRSHMTELHAAMAGQGPEAQRLGRQALGLAHLELREFEKAQELLDRAWQEGLRTPALARARSLVLAERYLGGQEKNIGIEDPVKREAERTRLRQELAEPARIALQADPGGGLEPPAHMEALQALLSDDTERCLERCREAAAQAPWFCEARYLEARILLLRWRLKDFAQPDRPDTFLQDTAAALATLREAQRLAPSDDRGPVLAGTLLTNAYVILRNVRGADAQQLFRLLREAGRFVGTALAIRPEDPAALQAWSRLMAQKAGFAYVNGLDARQETREAVARIQAALAGNKAFPARLRRTLGTLHHHLGMLQWNFGEDPRQTLEEAARLYGEGSPETAAVRGMLALSELYRGRPHATQLAAGEQALRLCKDRELGPVVLHTLWTQFLQTRLRCEIACGQPTAETVRRARSHIRLAMRGASPPYWLFITQMHLELTAAQAKLMEEGNAALELEAAETALARRREQSIDGLEAAELQGILTQQQAFQAFNEGRDPGPAIRRSQICLRRYAQAMPERQDIWANLSEGDWLAALAARRQGGPEVPSLEHSLAAIQRANRINGANPLRWVAQGRIHRRLALLDPARSAQHWAAAESCLGRARALNPRLPQVLAEGLAVAIQRDGASPEPLSELLNRFPVLRFDYRDATANPE